MVPPAPHNDTTLVLRHMFAASRQRVFRAWIEPDALERWFKPGGKNEVVSKLEAHVGGSFCFDIEDGSSIVGIYLHVVPPEQLAFTWSGGATRYQETIVTLNFFSREEETEVVLTHEGLNDPSLRALFGSGWSLLLEAFAGILSRQN